MKVSAFFRPLIGEESEEKKIIDMMKWKMIFVKDWKGLKIVSSKWASKKRGKTLLLNRPNFALLPDQHVRLIFNSKVTFIALHLQVINHFDRLLNF